MTRPKLKREGDKGRKKTCCRTTPTMPPTRPHLTPTKPTRPGGDEPLSPAKFSSNPPRTSRYLPQSPINFGARMSNDDAKEFAERRARQSLTQTKPLARFDSLCEDSKTILTNMAGMFSPGSAEPGTPEVSPFKIQMEKVPPSPVKGKRSRKDRRDNQGKQGQPRRKKVINRRQIKGRARPFADPIPEEG